MKRLETTIDPTELDDVWETLSEAGVERMTVLDVRIFDRRSAKRKVYFGAAYVEDFVLKLQITIVALDDQAAVILEALERSGKAVVVTPVVEAVRIRTDERGNDALGARGAFRPQDSPAWREEPAAKSQ